MCCPAARWLCPVPAGISPISRRSGRCTCPRLAVYGELGHAQPHSLAVLQDSSPCLARALLEPGEAVLFPEGGIMLTLVEKILFFVLAVASLAYTFIGFRKVY